MEKWQIICVGDLRALKKKEQSIANLEAELEEIKDRCGSIGAIKYDKERISGGTAYNPADQWLNDLVLSDQIEQQLRVVRCDIHRLRKILGMLTEEERILLTAFYIERQPRYIENLMVTLHMEKSSVYRAKDKALENFVLLAYGATSY